MRCPKCKFNFSERERVCPRCGEDVSLLAETLGPFYPVSSKEVILKDSLLTPPPFISEPASSEMEIPETPSTFPESHPEIEIREEVLKELQEALEEEKG